MVTATVFLVTSSGSITTEDPISQQALEHSAPANSTHPPESTYLAGKHGGGSIIPGQLVASLHPWYS